MTEPPTDVVEGGLDLDRVVLFSDAVFAIAMTVLALSLRLPDSTTNAGVASALRTANPAILAYFLSFAVIGLYWLAHHRYFHYIERVDTVLLTLNLVLLSLVAFLPFPTQVIGEHGSARAAVVFYAATVGLLGTAAAALWGYAAYHGRLLRPDTPRPVVRHTLLRSVSAAAVFALSIPVAFVSVSAARWFWLLIALNHAVLARIYRASAPARRAARTTDRRAGARPRDGA